MAGLIRCPACLTNCTVDPNDAGVVTCPNCGCVVSTKDETLVPQEIVDNTPLTCDDPHQVPTVSASVAQESLAKLPARIGRYNVECLLAQGGFARVYRARDAELDRVVALKLPRKERFKDEKTLNLFLSEARIAAKLRHPGIVTIFDVGQLTNDLPYIAMEYVQGQSLAKMMQSRPLPLSESVGVMIKIAEAIHAAIRQNVVHRDLKPANILIDERNEPRIVDFGLAVLEEDQVALEGEVAGTPAYMSPEQFRGDVHHLDARSDIWSLGVILYEMLTGRLPFKGTREELRRDVLTRNPKPPRQINDTIPNELEAICLKCLAKSPEGRYSTALDFANDLREWNIRTSTVDTGRRFSSLTTMGPNSPASEGRQTTRELSSSQGQFRNRFTAIFALVFLIAVLGLAGMLTLQGPAKENKGAAQVPPDDGDHNESQLVDARAEIGAWLPLIDRTPKILVSPGTSRMAGWNFDLPKAEVSVDAIWPYLISLGETEAVEYRLQLHLVKNSYTGQAGLFYGFQESTIEDVNDERVGTKIFRCEAVVFLSDDSVKPPIFRIKRLAFEFGPIENGSHTITHVHNGSVVDIPRPPPEELELELIVSEGYLRSIRWQRQELLTLTERPGRFRLKNGRFGIINELGATRFFDARYMMTVPKSLQ